MAQDLAIRRTQAGVILGLAFAAFTLWDYYFGAMGSGVRFFDLAAVGGLGMFLAAALGIRGGNSMHGTRLPAVGWVLVMLFVGVFVLAGLAGSIADPAALLRPTAGVWMGLFVFVIFYSVHVPAQWIERVTRWLILIHAAALIAQFTAFHAAGVLLNFQAILGATPRVLANIFRPSGLFLEPSNYSITISMLLLLRLRSRPVFDRIAWLAVGSALISFSLFGFLATFSILGFYFWRRVGWWVLAGVFVAGVIAAVPSIQELPEIVVLTDRLTSGGQDSSLMQRYGGLFSSLDAGGTALWFGEGLSNSYLDFGTSGIAFLLSSIGVLGVTLWLLLCAALAPSRRIVTALFSIVLILVAAPMWTTMFWWAWLGVLLNRNSAAPPRPQLIGSTACHNLRSQS
jgi:hypothetical protein